MRSDPCVKFCVDCVIPMTLFTRVFSGYIATIIYPSKHFEELLYIFTVNLYLETMSRLPPQHDKCVQYSFIDVYYWPYIVHYYILQITFSVGNVWENRWHKDHIKRYSVIVIHACTIITSNERTFVCIENIVMFGFFHFEGLRFLASHLNFNIWMERKLKLSQMITKTVQM